MANTYTQIHIQIVFAVKFRAAQIAPTWKANLHRFITKLVQNAGHKMLQVNSMPDHIHIFVGLRPDDAISNLVRTVKSESTKWINNEKFTAQKFHWQSGYGAFSYSKSDVQRVIQYIQNQEAHHKRKTFLEEYQEFLKRFEIDYDDAYIFSPLI